MLKYTATHAFNADTTQDPTIILPMIFAILIIMLLIHSINNLENEDKKLPVNTVDSCCSTYLNINDKRLEQKLTPIRRTRSRETVDSMV